MSVCLHIHAGLEREPGWGDDGMAPASGIPVENQLVVCERPSLYATDIAVIEGSGDGKRESGSIVEVRPESEQSVIKRRIRLGGISAGKTGEEERIFAVDGTFHDKDPFFPSRSRRWELRGVPGDRGGLTGEMRSRSPSTVFEDLRDADPMPRLRSRGGDDEGEESGKDKERGQEAHFRRGERGIIVSRTLH